MAIIQGRHTFDLHEEELSAAQATVWYDEVRK